MSEEALTDFIRCEGRADFLCVGWHEGKSYFKRFLDMQCWCVCSNALAAVGGTTAGPGSCVLNNYVNYEKRFAFIELRTGT